MTVENKLMIDALLGANITFTDQEPMLVGVGADVDIEVGVDVDVHNSNPIKSNSNPINSNSNSNSKFQSNQMIRRFFLTM